MGTITNVLSGILFDRYSAVVPYFFIQISGPLFARTPILTTGVLHQAAVPIRKIDSKNVTIPPKHNRLFLFLIFLSLQNNRMRNYAFFSHNVYKVAFSEQKTTYCITSELLRVPRYGL